MSNIHAFLVEASQCLADGRTSKAKKLAEQAVAQAPGSADAHMVLADALAARSETESARKHYARATECETGHFGAWLNYGVFLKEIQEFRNAVKCFKNAVIIDPKSSLARYNLARTMMLTQQYREAMEEFKTFVRMEPHFADGFFSLGVTQELASEYDDALASHQTALRLDPQLARAHFGVATVYQTMGKFEEAEPYYRKAIEIDPTFGKGYIALITARGFSEEDADETLQSLKTALDDPELPLSVRVSFLFSAFKILDQQEKYDEAFQFLADCNQIRDGAMEDKQEKQVRLWSRVKSTFTKEFFDDREIFGNTTEQPVFIVGMPRSGTTLTEQIIASHPSAFGAGELDGFGNVLSETVERIDNPSVYPQYIVELPEAALRDTAQRYLEMYPAEAKPFDRVTDKLPDNYMNLGVFALLFPNARFIWCRRNAMDTCLSCFSQNFSSPIWYSANQQKLAQRYLDHVDLNEHWKTVLPNRVLEIRYEELTRDPEPNIRKLIDFCGLEWNDACLNFHETERAVRTASIWQVRQPMYTSSVGKWKNYEKHLGPLIEGLGDLANE